MIFGGKRGIVPGGSAVGGVPDIDPFLRIVGVGGMKQDPGMVRVTEAACDFRCTSGVFIDDLGGRDIFPVVSAACGYSNIASVFLFGAGFAAEKRPANGNVSSGDYIVLS